MGKIELSLLPTEFAKENFASKPVVLLIKPATYKSCTIANAKHKLLF